MLFSCQIQGLCNSYGMSSHAESETASQQKCLHRPNVASPHSNACNAKSSGTSLLLWFDLASQMERQLTECALSVGQTSPQLTFSMECNETRKTECCITLFVFDFTSFQLPSRGDAFSPKNGYHPLCMEITVWLCQLLCKSEAPL